MNPAIPHIGKTSPKSGDRASRQENSRAPWRRLSRPLAGMSMREVEPQLVLVALGRRGQLDQQECACEGESKEKEAHVQNGCGKIFLSANKNDLRRP
jgi:hypothetical protein